MKIIDVNQVITDEDRQLAVVRQHARHDGWWDSPKKYQCVNRNVVSIIQRNKFFDIIVALYGGSNGVGLGIGGRHTEGYYEINVNPGSAPDMWGDGRWLPIKDNSINFITNSHTLEHIPDTFKTLTEWIRVTKPGGVIAMTMPDKTHFLHDNENPNHKYYDLAPSEMTAAELKVILDKLENVEILIFNSNLNNFDIDILLRKK